MGIPPIPPSPHKWKVSGTSIIPSDNTKDVGITKADPEIRQTDSGNSEYTRITKADTSNVAQRFNRVSQPGSATGVQFDAGTTDFISVVDSASISPTTAMAIEFWAKPGATSAEGWTLLFDKGSSWRIQKLNTRLLFNFPPFDFSIYAEVTTGPFVANTWKHFKWIYNGAGATNADKLKCHINGVDAALTFAGTVPATIVDSAAALNMYFASAGGGTLDEIVMYNTNDTSDGYNGGLGVFHTSAAYPTAVGIWHLDENTGTTTADSSGNSNTGTFNGTPTWTTGTVPAVASTIEANIWKSEDGTAANEGGKLTIGNTGIANNGTTTINANNLILTINDVEKARLTSDGILGIGTAAPTPTSAGSAQITGFLSVGDSATATGIGAVMSKVSGSNRGAYYGGDTSYAMGLGSALGDVRFTVNNTNRFFVENNDNVICGQLAAVATTATAGFLYIPSCAGTPTGVPTAKTGKVPLVYDSTNNILYVYANGAWRTH